MNLDQLSDFLRREIKSFVTDAVRIRPAHGVEVAPDPQERQAELIKRASHGAAVRQILESEIFQDFMARQEAQLTSALIGLPLDDDAGRRNLAVAIQTQRQWVKFLGEASRDGRAAEAELQRLADGPRSYF